MQPLHCTLLRIGAIFDAPDCICCDPTVESCRVTTARLGACRLGYVRFAVKTIKELIQNVPDLAVLVEPLLVVRRVLREQLGVLHRRLLTVVRDDAV